MPEAPDAAPDTDDTSTDLTRTATADTAVAGTDAVGTDADADSASVATLADATLLAAVDLARAGLLEITTADTIGDVIGHIEEGERVISLLFDCLMTGYPGWRWTVSLARADAASEPTVLETELTPGDGSLLAPEWVPWSDRLVDGDTAADDDDDSDDDSDDDDDDSDDDDDDDDDSDDDDSDDDDSDDDDSDDNDDDSDDDDSDDDADPLDDTDDSVDVLDGIDFDEALAAAQLNPGESAETEASPDHGAPQPPTRSRRARRA